MEVKLENLEVEVSHEDGQVVLDFGTDLKYYLAPDLARELAEHLLYGADWIDGQSSL